MGDAFDAVLGQPKVVDFLRRSVHEDSVSHAYLFTGPAESGTAAAAWAFAQALLCPQGGCGTCDACVRVQRRSHPDANWIEPQGAAGYLIEQIRDVVADVTLAPVMACRKVYVIDDADHFTTASANAFLKTLEEPPDDVVIILLARTRESVLPTIASRCLGVTFRHIPMREAADLVARQGHVQPDQARAALAACDGDIQGAVAFCASSACAALRTLVIEALESLDGADDWKILSRSQRIGEAAKAPIKELERILERDMQDKASYLSHAAQRQIEQRNKRELNAATRRAMLQVASIVRSWLRDAMLLSTGMRDEMSNPDARAGIERMAARTSLEQLVAAIGAVDHCSGHIAYNVTAQLCIDSMLLTIKRELFG